MSDNNKFITDDSYLTRLKKKGKSDEFISAKLGIEVAEVRKRWDALMQMEGAEVPNGHLELLAVARVLGEQFQLLGQSLGLFQGAIGNTYEPTELRAIIQACPPGQDLAAYLLGRVIILKPFEMPSVQRLAAEMEQAPTPSKK